MRYFKEFERFNRHIENLCRRPAEKRVVFVSICAPNQPRAVGQSGHEHRCTFFDRLLWLFGDVDRDDVYVSDLIRCRRYLELEHVQVRGILSIDREDLPRSCRESGLSIFYSIIIDGEEVEFSGGVTDLHAPVYQDIPDGGGKGSTLPDPRSRSSATSGQRSWRRSETMRIRCSNRRN